MEIRLKTTFSNWRTELNISLRNVILKIFHVIWHLGMWNCWLVLVLGSDNILNQTLSPGVLFTICIIKIVRIKIRIFSICFELRSNIILRGNNEVIVLPLCLPKMFLFFVKTHSVVLSYFKYIQEVRIFKLWFMSMIILHRLFSCCCDFVQKINVHPTMKCINLRVSIQYFLTYIFKM